jgi:hypothetical protein
MEPNIALVRREYKRAMRINPNDCPHIKSLRNRLIEESASAWLAFRHPEGGWVKPLSVYAPTSIGYGHRYALRNGRLISEWYDQISNDWNRRHDLGIEEPDCEGENGEICMFRSPDQAEAWTKDVPCQPSPWQGEGFLMTHEPETLAMASSDPEIKRVIAELKAARHNLVSAGREKISNADWRSLREKQWDLEERLQKLTPVAYGAVIEEDGFTEICPISPGFECSRARIDGRSTYINFCINRWGHVTVRQVIDTCAYEYSLATPGREVRLKGWDWKYRAAVFDSREDAETWLAANRHQPPRRDG